MGISDIFEINQSVGSFLSSFESKAIGWDMESAVKAILWSIWFKNGDWEFWWSRISSGKMVEIKTILLLCFFLEYDVGWLLLYWLWSRRDSPGLAWISLRNRQLFLFFMLFDLTRLECDHDVESFTFTCTLSIACFPQLILTLLIC